MVQRQQALNCQQNDEEVLEEYVVVADCLDLRVYDRVHDCVEHLRGEGEDEERGGAGLMPFLIHLASVDGGSVAHQQKGAHEADDHHHLWMVFSDIEGVVPADGLEVEVVGEPSHGCEDGSRDGGEAKEDELGVVLRAFADPAVGEGRLVAVDLRDLVDDEERGDDDEGAELEEQRGCEGTLEHVDFYSIKYSSITLLFPQMANPRKITLCVWLSREMTRLCDQSTSSMPLSTVGLLISYTNLKFPTSRLME